jgi:hypothetical protein
MPIACPFGNLSRIAYCRSSPLPTMFSYFFNDAGLQGVCSFALNPAKKFLLWPPSASVGIGGGVSPI